MRLARIAVGWSGGLLSFFGALYAVAAARMLGYSELTGLSPTALTDARVMYGAFELGPGLFLLSSVKRDEWLDPALALATITFACVPAVRLFGMIADGAANAFHVSALCIEIATFALAAVAWYQLRHAR